MREFSSIKKRGCLYVFYKALQDIEQERRVQMQGKCWKKERGRQVNRQVRKQKWSHWERRAVEKSVIDAHKYIHKISFRVRLAYAIYLDTHRRVHSKTLSLLLLSLAGTAALRNSYSSMRARYSSVLDIMRAWSCGYKRKKPWLGLKYKSYWS